jgi:hypothetical protein
MSKTACPVLVVSPAELNEATKLLFDNFEEVVLDFYARRAEPPKPA